jgi:hypothetical protein
MFYRHANIQRTYDETYNLPSFMANPAAQMLENFGKLVWVSLGFFYFHYFKQFFLLYSIKSLYIVLAILLLRSLKNSSNSKSMRVTSLSTC